MAKKPTEKATEKSPATSAVAKKATATKARHQKNRCYKSTR